MDFAEHFISKVLSQKRDGTDSKSSDDALYIELLLSPLRKQSDGNLWPFFDKADGLLWIMAAVALLNKDSESELDKADTQKIEDYLRWCLLADLRYQFKNGDKVAGKEVLYSCSKLGLYVPVDIQDWINEQINEMDDNMLVTKRQTQTRETQNKTRAISVEIDTLTALFPKLTVTAAIGSIISRYEQHGVGLSYDKINSHLYRDGKRREAISMSWLLSQKPDNDIDDSLLSIWREIWMERYPEETRLLLKNSI